MTRDYQSGALGLGMTKRKAGTSSKNIDFHLVSNEIKNSTSIFGHCDNNYLCVDSCSQIFPTLVPRQDISM